MVDPYVSPDKDKYSDDFELGIDKHAGKRRWTIDTYKEREHKHKTPDMKKQQLKNIIKECVKEILSEGWNHSKDPMTKQDALRSAIDGAKKIHASKGSVRWMITLGNDFIDAQGATMFPSVANELGEKPTQFFTSSPDKFRTPKHFAMVLKDIMSNKWGTHKPALDLSNAEFRVYFPGERNPSTGVNVKDGEVLVFIDNEAVSKHSSAMARDVYKSGPLGT
jgi:hypothetical protein